MLNFSSLVLAGIALMMTTSQALPVEQQQQQQQQKSYTLRTVHQFPNKTWIENIAIRSNGQILGTNLLGGNVFLVDPKLSQDVAPPVIASFGEKTALTGIAEVEDDVFYVQGVQNSTAIAFQFPANASSVWRIDMRPYSRTGQAKVDKVADIPQILLPNGMTLLSKAAGTVLIADSALGKIWRFCVRTGQHEVVNDDAILKPISGKFPSFGVNGLEIIGGGGSSSSTLFFTNTNQGLVGRFQILPNGRPLGKPTVISSATPNADDFAVGPDGSIWVAENKPNTVVRVFPNGKVVTVVGGQQNSTSTTTTTTTPQLPGPVAAKFGRTIQDRNTLYVSTDGLTLGSNGKPVTSDGRIVAINTLP